MTTAERIIRVAKAAKLPVITIKHQVYTPQCYYFDYKRAIKEFKNYMKGE